MQAESTERQKSALTAIFVESPSPGSYWSMNLNKFAQRALLDVCVCVYQRVQLWTELLWWQSGRLKAYPQPGQTWQSGEPVEELVFFFFLMGEKHENSARQAGVMCEKCCPRGANSVIWGINAFNFGAHALVSTFFLPLSRLQLLLAKWVAVAWMVGARSKSKSKSKPSISRLIVPNWGIGEALNWL